VKFKELLPYHALTVISSSVSYSILLIIIEPSYRAVIAFFMISLITIIPYSVAAVPLQIFLNKWPKKFNILYLFTYCVVAILFLYISYKLHGTNMGLSWNVYTCSRCSHHILVLGFCYHEQEGISLLLKFKSKLANLHKTLSGIYKKENLREARVLKKFLIMKHADFYTLLISYPL